MRLGKEKKGKASKSKGRRTKPKYSSPDLVPGQVSSNLIATFFETTLSDLATQRLEQYAEDLLNYEDQLRLLKNETAAEIDADGSVKNEKVGIPSPPPRPLFHSQHTVDEFVQMMSDISRHFSAQTNGWKIHANAAKFERLLDERYGIFRPFVTNHPEIEQFVRSVQRKYAMGYFSPLRQGSPPIPRTTAIIILFMMQRGNVRLDALFLAALFFLVGLQPWALVTIVALIQYVLTKRRNRAIGRMPKFIPSLEPYYNRTNSMSTTAEDESTRKLNFLRQPVGSKLGDSEHIDAAAFDTMILGSGPGALYCAALLSRAGRKVLVLSPADDASGCLTFACCNDTTLAEKYKSVPFDVDASNIARLAKQQEILAPALCTSTDYQGGIRFAQVGTVDDGFAFEILSIQGMGADGINDEIPFVLKATGGPDGLMDDAATYLGDGWPGSDGDVGNSTSGAYLNACNVMNASAGDFYLSKILPDSINDLRSRTTYQESAIRYVAPFLDKCFPLNAHVRSLMAGIGMKGENLRPSSTSMGAHVTNVCAAVSGEGMHYPIGGPRALCHALGSVVEQNGGLVKTGIIVKDLLFEYNEGKKKLSELATSGKTAVESPPRCIGVKLFDDREVKFGKEGVNENPVVISMLGFVHTFIRLLPDDIRVNHSVPRGLPALTEQRPVFKILIGLKGTAEDLNVTGADLYRLPGASIAEDEYDSAQGNISLGVIGGSSKPDVDGEAVDETTPLTGDIDSTTSNPNEGSNVSQRVRRGKKSNKVVFEPGSSWMQISFPSAKDPSFQSCHGDLTTCVVTVEADDDFVVLFDTKPKVYTVRKESADSKERLRLLERVQSDLLHYYPQLEGKIEHIELHGPIFRGLSHNPERYAAKGVRAESPYPGLFMGGSDLTVGESFAGSVVAAWLAANAVKGYNAIDYIFLQKNITSDLERFIEHPVLEDFDGDTAVPFTHALANALPSHEVDGDALFHETVEHDE